jgi:CheY-like chemotaxis protein
MKRRDGKQGSLFWFEIPYKPDKIYAKHMMKHSAQKDLRNSNNPFNQLSSLLSKSQEGGGGYRKNMSSSSLSTLSQISTDNEMPTNNNNHNQSLKRTNNAADPAVDSSAESNNNAPSSLTILLVDDSPTIVKMSSLMLKRLGHKVFTAENGAIALKLLETYQDQESITGSMRGVKRKGSRSMANGMNDNNHAGAEDSADDITVTSIRRHRPFFDIVLMDLQMPVMDGLEATKRIRKRESAQFVSTQIEVHQVIIGTSANCDTETMDQAFAAGIDGFLPKPFNVDSLRATLDQILG